MLPHKQCDCFIRVVDCSSEWWTSDDLSPPTEPQTWFIKLVFSGAQVHIKFPSGSEFI